MKNISDSIRTFFAMFHALFVMIRIYPDVVVSKGAYPAFPIVIAARILRIPVVMHESDMAAGRVNKITANFAKRIAVSFPEAVNLFGKKEVTAWTGQPIQKELWETSGEKTHAYFNLKKNLPIIVIYGGSLGSQLINDAVLEVLPMLVEDFQIIHQVGVANEQEIKSRAKFLLTDSPYKERYQVFGFFNPMMQKMLGASADLFISRAGATSIFEMAIWKRPAILIPITKSNGDHQRKNAYAYASTGAAIVIEENNLEPHVFLSEIQRMMGDKSLLENMANSGQSFVQKEAASTIAKEVVTIALGHEK